MNKPSLNINLERRRVLTTGDNKGRSHIKIWVTFVTVENGQKKWKQRPYKTGLYCTEKEFAAVINENIRRVPTRIYDIRVRLNELKRKALHIIEEMGVSDEKTFESYFLSDYAVEAVAGHFKSKIDELARRGKISSKENYENALKAFQKFFGDNFTFQDCTPDRLLEFEEWFTSQNRFKDTAVRRRGPAPVKLRSLTTVGIYMRSLRHIFRRANKGGITTLYPFGVGKYVIPEGGDDTKKFLSTDEKDKFITWTAPNDEMSKLHDYAKFIYYANGINVADLARLRRSNLFDEYIAIDRQKSKGRKKKQKKLIIPMHPVMRDIISRRGKRSLVPDDFVFPVLELGMTEEAMFFAVRRLVDAINDTLAYMAKDLGLSMRPTTYTLRHTFAFQFMRLGGSTEELQDALGHGMIQTTENYKHGFELEKKRKYSEGL